VKALTARHCISRLASPVIWPGASAAMSAKLRARRQQKRPVDMPIRVSRLLLNGLSFLVLHRIFSSSRMNAGFAQNTAKQRTVFLGAFLKDRRTLPNNVCEAPRKADLAGETPVVERLVQSRRWTTDSDGLDRYWQTQQTLTIQQNSPRETAI